MEKSAQMTNGSNVRQDDAAIKRVEFHVHSSFIAEEKVLPVEIIIEQATQRGYRAIGIIGKDGIRSFISAEKKAKQAGLLPIFGIQATIVDEEGRPFECYVYAKNLMGKKHLFKLVSLSLCAENNSLSKNSMEALRDGLMISGGSAGSELFEAVLNKSREEAETIARFFDVLEINPVPVYKQYFAGEGLVFSDAELEAAIGSICEIGEKLGIEVIAVGNVEDFNQQSEAPFYTTDEMLREFEHLGLDKAYEVVVVNTNKIADRFEAYDLLPDRRLFPVIKDGNHRIRSLCYSGAEGKYGNPLPDVVKYRLERELLPIIQNGFAVPYLIAAQVVKQSLSDGYMVGTRGSVGSSLAAYFLGISEMNPLPPHYACHVCKYNEWEISDKGKTGLDLPDKLCPQCGYKMKGDGHDIPCEMFLGMKLDKAPDIDLNVAVEYQERAHDGLKELFGHHNVFFAGTMANGRHPGGVIILPDGVDMEEVTPVQYTEQRGSMSWLQTHFDYHDIDHIVFKLDILQHEGPSRMRLLRDLTGVGPAAVPLNDPKVLQLFRSTAPLGLNKEQIRTSVATCGIPEMGTPFVRSMLEETQPSTFFELLQISGLSHGTGTWEGNARELIRSEVCTLQSAIGLRDNIMQSLITHGMEADLAFKITENVRKGKGIPGDWIDEMKTCGLQDWYINSCQKIKYLFPKAHAVSYVISAIRNAYYKLYFPLEYYAAYFTVRGKTIDVEVCSQGYEAILEKLLQMEEQAENHPGHSCNIMSLEVALEMTARGFHFKKGNDGRFYVADSVRSIAVPAAAPVAKT
ncbi:PHP domain-containing protein [Paenibacillus hemerocallicola]|uniref:DNA polymerase III PolC-type n=1 Tax=Paenibacillus hemerocallicola TaxID=1172614 RepID=A0A5C4TBI9_9BACL|nr:PHP domain-containing protein [Paenibacillus hemerocallicola]TNJ65960.1 PHP domain-containing protein [Paenibacillus hemerocallicola]